MEVSNLILIGYYFAYIKFDKKILVPNKMIFLGANIDIDISENKKDRLAFYGKIIFSNNDLKEVINNFCLENNLDGNQYKKILDAVRNKIENLG